MMALREAGFVGSQPTLADCLNIAPGRSLPASEKGYVKASPTGPSDLPSGVFGYSSPVAGNLTDSACRSTTGKIVAGSPSPCSADNTVCGSMLFTPTVVCSISEGHLPKNGRIQPGFCCTKESEQVQASVCPAGNVLPESAHIETTVLEQQSNFKNELDIVCKPTEFHASTYPSQSFGYPTNYHDLKTTVLYSSINPDSSRYYDTTNGLRHSDVNKQYLSQSHANGLHHCGPTPPAHIYSSPGQYFPYPRKGAVNEGLCPEHMWLKEKKIDKKATETKRKMIKFLSFF